MHRLPRWLRRPSRPATAGALTWLGLVAMVGLLAPWLPLPYAPTDIDLAQLAAPPSWHGSLPHYLGTDPVGRDVLTGVVTGARQLLLSSLPATVLATVLGALLGGAAGYWGNQGLRLPWPALLAGAAAGLWWLHPPLAVGAPALLALGLWASLRWRRGAAVPLDAFVLGGGALLGTVPRLLLVLALATGPPLEGAWLVGLLALLVWPDLARLVRTQMRQVRALPYVEAARATGLPEWVVWWHHALPAACRPLWSFAPLALASLIGLESTLGFLGVGEAAANATWGQLLSELRQEPSAWWLVAGPGTALLGTLLALQLLARRRAA